MTNAARDEVIRLYGGEVDVDSLPTVLPIDSFYENVSSIVFAESIFNGVLQQQSNDNIVSIVVTRSTSLGCVTRKLDEKEYIILIPLGFITRIRVFTRILLQFWENPIGIRLLNSSLDPIPDEAWAIPPKLRSVLGIYELGAEESFWSNIAELDKEIKIPEGFEADVRELMHLALIYILSHEFGHVLQRHFEYRRQLETTPILEVNGLTRGQFQRGLELHADIVAATFSVDILLGQLKSDYGTNDINPYVRGFLRLSYCITMLYAIFDVHRKYIFSYEHDTYTAPVIRRQLFNDIVTNTVKEREKQVVEIWSEMELYGWHRCVQALNDLAIQCKRGKYGKVTDRHLLSVTALIYGRTAAFNRVLVLMIQEDYALARKVEKILLELDNDHPKSTQWTDALPDRGDSISEFSHLFVELSYRHR